MRRRHVRGKQDPIFLQEGKKGEVVVWCTTAAQDPRTSYEVSQYLAVVLLVAVVPCGSCSNGRCCCSDDLFLLRVHAVRCRSSELAQKHEMEGSPASEVEMRMWRVARLLRCLELLGVPHQGGGGLVLRGRRRNRRACTSGILLEDATLGTLNRRRAAVNQAEDAGLHCCSENQQPRAASSLFGDNNSSSSFSSILLPFRCVPEPVSCPHFIAAGP